MMNSENCGLVSLTVHTVSHRQYYTLIFGICQLTCKDFPPTFPDRQHHALPADTASSDTILYFVWAGGAGDGTYHTVEMPT